MNMSLKQLSENKRLAGQLSALLASGKVVHAFLIAGGAAPERLELGTAFAKALLCPESADDSCDRCASCRKFDDGNHEDFIKISRREGKQSILSEQIEELRSRIKFKPVGERNIVLIEDADSMNDVSQNKLLKCLEEPVSETVMILLASGSDGLLQTVVSRCSSYYIDGGQEDDPDMRSIASALLKQCMASAPYYRKKAALEGLLQKGEDNRQQAMDLADALEAECLEALKRSNDNDKKLFGIAEAASELRIQLSRGYNTQYALKQLCLRI